MTIEQTPGSPDGDSAQDAKHPTDISWQALAPALVLSSVAFILVVIRWYTRRFIVGRTGADDYIITLSAVRKTIPHLKVRPKLK